MKKNILIIGNKHLLSAVLEALFDTPFLLENKIDIIISSPFGRQRKPLIKQIKKIWKFNLAYSIDKINEKILLKINQSLYKNELKQFITFLFPSKNMNHLKSYPNIDFLEYDGFNIKNLEKYDIMLVASFSQKIPREIFQKPRLGTLNIHPSFLPELRGGYPLYVQTYFQRSTCDVSIHFMDEKWDHGEIIDQKSSDFYPQATYQERMDCSAKLASDILNDLHRKEFVIIPKAQSHMEASYCHRILKMKHNIDNFDQNDSFEGYVLANYHDTQFPFSFTYYKGFVFSILKVKRTEGMKYPKSKGLFRIDNKFYYNFFGNIYLIVEYIYKGKLISV